MAKTLYNCSGRPISPTKPEGPLLVGIRSVAGQHIEQRATLVEINLVQEP